MDGLVKFPRQETLEKILASLEKIDKIVEEGMQIARQYGPDAVPAKLEEKLDAFLLNLAEVIKREHVEGAPLPHQVMITKQPSLH